MLCVYVYDCMKGAILHCGNWTGRVAGTLQCAVEQWSTPSCEELLVTTRTFFISTMKKISTNPELFQFQEK